MSATCPWCNAPRESGPACPRCGADYAKAEAIRKQGRAGRVARALEPQAQPAPPAGAQYTILAQEKTVADPGLELRFCIAAIPSMLLLATAFHLYAPFLQRIFFGMPVHELGHATAAWLCGHWAIPTFWKTPIAESRGLLMPLLVLGGVGYVMYRAWLAENRLTLALGGAVIVLQLAGTLLVSQRTAQMLIVFGGDGMGMILAALLMASFFFGKDTQLYKGSLRWGFVAIGAAAFADLFGTWVAAKRDHGKIPFGEMEGVGDSDAVRLVDDFGWTADELVNRHLAVGILCMLALAGVYAWGVWRAWREVQKGGRAG